MKRLIIFDFDATLINSPEKQEGIIQWQKNKGEEYPYAGWWGRPESLDLDVFDIKPFPNILFELKKESVIPNTHIIILTSRMEKLRPQVQAVLDKNNIVVDELIMKRGTEDKGDIILNYVKNNPELKKIVAYDDFAGGMQNKINEYTKIKDILNEKGIQYDVIKIVDGKISNIVESCNNPLYIIVNEIKKLI